MKWIRESDRFLLSREELGDFVLFSLAIYSMPRKHWPIGYLEFHRKRIRAADKLMLQYLKYQKDLNPTLKRALLKSVRMR